MILTKLTYKKNVRTKLFLSQDYEKIAPPNSFIHADDFDTPEVSFLM